MFVFLFFCNFFIIIIVCLLFCLFGFFALLLSKVFVIVLMFKEPRIEIGFVIISHVQTDTSTEVKQTPKLETHWIRRT